MRTFYKQRLVVSGENAEKLVANSQNIQVWSRMAFKEQLQDESRVVYFGTLQQPQKPDSRRNYYFAGEYLDESDQISETESSSENSHQRFVYYGRSRAFIEHDLEHNGRLCKFLLFVGDGVVRVWKKENKVRCTLNLVKMMNYCSPKQLWIGRTLFSVIYLSLRPSLKRRIGTAIARILWMRK